jgi:hypothetical protein
MTEFVTTVPHATMFLMGWLVLPEESRRHPISLAASKLWRYPAGTTRPRRLEVPAF